MGRWSALSAAATLMVAHSCFAQLLPTRTYYGKGQPIPMTVTIPDGAAGEAEVRLMAPGAADEVLEVAAVAAGPVNMATNFPTLWTAERPRLVYAQLFVAGEKVGAPVVIQPLISPAVAMDIDTAGNPRFPNDATRQKTFSGLRAYVDRRVVLETDKGEIELALRPDAAPNTVWNFLQLVEGGFYTDIPFHRIVAANPRGDAFVIQTGDPTGTGMGGPGYFIDLEPSPLPHGFGVVSMARMNDPNTNGSQLFISLSRSGTAMLDGKYAAFGQAVRGGEVIQAIAAVPVGSGDRPEEPAPRIITARLVDAPPFGDGPQPVPEPGTGPITK